MISEYEHIWDELFLNIVNYVDSFYRLRNTAYDTLPIVIIIQVLIPPL